MMTAWIKKAQTWWKLTPYQTNGDEEVVDYFWKLKSRALLSYSHVQSMEVAVNKDMLLLVSVLFIVVPCSHVCCNSFQKD